MIEYKNVRIPASADEWELYSSEPGSEEAADALTAAAKAAVDIICDAKLDEAAQVPIRALERIFAAQREHMDLGAFDSEPIGKARGVVVRAMKAIAGIEIDPWSL